MPRIASLFFLLFFVQLRLSAQVLPGEGSSLNYRRIGFSFPPVKNATRYKVEIAAGDEHDDALFKAKTIRCVYCNASRVIVEVPYFGQQYTWRVTAFVKGGKTAPGMLNHFSTGWIPEVDSCQMRLRVLKRATKYKGHYVFVDGHKVLYDMNGQPIWYLPMHGDVALGKSEIRDLKLSPYGTITYLQRERIHEISYNGDTLWSPHNDGRVSGDTTEHYHHEFTRLANGHYMVLGSEAVLWDHSYGPATDSVISAAGENGMVGNRPVRRKVDFGTVLEYNKKGELVWSWKSSGYFMQSDLVNYRPEHRTKTIDVHENAFFFDEKDSVIYISFKNIGRILKIKYPGGEVLASYGEVFKPGVKPTGNGWFCDQHGCKYSKNGYLYLYNNNACNDSTEMPSVVLLQEPEDGRGELMKIWEYHCTMDGININPSIKGLKERQALLEKKNMKPRLGRGTLLRATSGGNVIELPDRSLFVSMNTQYCKMFIVNRDKKILWSAVPERYYPLKNDWFITLQQYRASIISRKELDNLIWNAEKH